MKQMKKLLSLSLAALMAALALCSCGVKKDNNAFSAAADDGASAVESAESTAE